MKLSKTGKLVYSLIVALIVSFSFFVFSCSSGSNQRVSEFDSATQLALEKVVQDHMTVQGFEIPGAVTGVWTPEGIWVKAFGVSDLETQSPMKTTHYFRIGSITKTFTASIILQLKDEGKLSLDDTLAFYGFDEVPNAEIITIRHLLNMTSGIFEYTDDEDLKERIGDDLVTPIPPQDLLDYAAKHPAYFPPGDQFRYTNTNYIILGLLIEKVTGNTFEDELDSRILGPMGLKQTVYPAGPYLGEEFCTGYAVESGVVTDTSVFSPSFAWAAGGMTSNLTDMKRWAEILATGVLLTPGTQQERMTWNGLINPASKMRYCLGAYYLGKDTIYGHTGSIPGYTSAAFYMPSRKATLVVLANANFMDMDSVIEGLAKVIYPDDVD